MAVDGNPFSSVVNNWICQLFYVLIIEYCLWKKEWYSKFAHFLYIYISPSGAGLYGVEPRFRKILNQSVVRMAHDSCQRMVHDSDTCIYDSF